MSHDASRAVNPELRLPLSFRVSEALGWSLPLAFAIFSLAPRVKRAHKCNVAEDDIILRTAVSPFPIGYCPASQQQFANDIADAIEVFFPGEFALTIQSPNQPTVEQRSMIWAKTDASTGVIVGFYTWNTTIGAWARNHWPLGVIPTYERRIFVGTLAQLEVFDGGESGTVSQSTGPFWERDTAFNDLWPLGVGSLIAAPLTTLAVFDDATPGAPNAIGVYIIKPTARLWDRAV